MPTFRTFCNLARPERLIRAYGPHPFGAHFVRPNRLLRFVELPTISVDALSPVVKIVSESTGFEAS